MKLIVEQPCEHGHWRICDHIPTERRDGGCIRLTCDAIHELPGCPGGSRRVIEPDYHAAATRLGEVKGDPDGYAAAQLIVDAALRRFDDG